MSYDLLVFAPRAAPADRGAFLEWWEAQSEWAEGHSYDDPEVSTPELRSWFFEMIKSFPPMNGPFAAEELPPDDSAVTDYSIGKHVIYAAFAWSEAEVAYEKVFSLAGKHGVGVLDASSDTAAVWLPDGKGGLVLAHEEDADRDADA